MNPWLEAHHYAPLKDGVLASDFLKRPEIDYQTMAQFLPDNPTLDHRVIEQVEIQIKYAGYIAKEEASVAKLKRLEGKRFRYVLTTRPSMVWQLKHVRSWLKSSQKPLRRRVVSAASILLMWRFCQCTLSRDALVKWPNKLETELPN